MLVSYNNTNMLLKGFLKFWTFNHLIWLSATLSYKNQNVQWALYPWVLHSQVQVTTH